MRGIEEWVVQSDPTKKGRSFPVTGMGLLTSGNTAYKSPERPLWAVFACEEGALRPVLANLQMGRMIQRQDSRHNYVEFQRSVGYEMRVQQLPDGLAVVTVYKPGIFSMNPGPVDPNALIHYVCLPTLGWAGTCGLTDAECGAAAERAWAAKAPTKANKTPGVGEGGKGRSKELFAQLVPQAALVAAYLDHRTGCPLLADPGYYLHLYLTMLAEGHAIVAGGDDGGYRDRRDYVWWCDPGLGYANPTVVTATHDDIREVLARTVTEYRAAM